MLQRIRQFFHDSDVTVGVVVGVVGGFVLVEFVHALVIAFVIPVFLKAFGQPEFNAGGLGFIGSVPEALTFHIGDVKFNYSDAVAWGFTLAIIAGVIYLVFVRTLSPSDAEDLRTRECPECRSEIWADARRCRFCTSAVEPLEAAQA